MRPIPSWALLSTGCVSYFLSSCSVKVQRLAGSSLQVSTRVTFSISLTGFLQDSSLPLPLPRFLSPSHLSVFPRAAFSLGLGRKENAFRGQAEVAWWCLACKPRTSEGKAEDQEVFKASLCYTACSRPSWATMRLYLKNNQNKQCKGREKEERRRERRRREHLLKQIKTIITTLMIPQQYPVKTNVTSFNNCYSYNWAVRVMTQW